MVSRLKANAAKVETSTRMACDTCADFEAVGRTDRGRMRRSNEDAMALDGESRAFVVCDGMGGAAAGETASRMAADTALAGLAGADASPASLSHAVERANTAVFQRGSTDSRLEGMGTTLVALLLGEETAWVAHVGDSRCYLRRGGRLSRLTEDHSWVEEQVRTGRMSPEQARRSPMGNLITRAIGTRRDVLAEISEVKLECGDLFLLASDGLTRELSDARLDELLGGTDDLSAACERLVEAANAAGGRDNITCVLVRIR